MSNLSKDAEEKMEEAAVSYSSFDKEGGCTQMNNVALDQYVGFKAGAHFGHALETEEMKAEIEGIKNERDCYHKQLMQDEDKIITLRDKISSLETLLGIACEALEMSYDLSWNMETKYSHKESRVFTETVLESIRKAREGSSV